MVVRGKSLETFTVSQPKSGWAELNLLWESWIRPDSKHFPFAKGAKEVPFPWKLGWFHKAIPAPRYAQVQCWVLLLSCVEEGWVFLWVMRMPCFVQNGLLGVSEHSRKCVINEEVVTCPAYCSLFCWSQGKLSEPEGSMWCSKHDLLPCDGSREQICLAAALCLLQSCVAALPVLSLIHGDFTLLTQLHTCWGDQILHFQVFSHMAGRKLWSLTSWLVENTLVKSHLLKHTCKQKKISLCISLISPVVSPHLVAV